MLTQDLGGLMESLLSNFAFHTISPYRLRSTEKRATDIGLQALEFARNSFALALSVRQTILFFGSFVVPTPREIRATFEFELLRASAGFYSSSISVACSQSLLPAKPEIIRHALPRGVIARQSSLLQHCPHWGRPAYHRTRL
jgi:hypothetical protein